MIIDFHTHIFPPEISESRGGYMADPRFKRLYDSEKSPMADAADLAEYMESSGIDASVAMSFPWSEDNFCAHHNEYMAETAAEYRGRIFPFGMISQECRSPQREAEKIKGSELYGIGEIAFYEGMDKGSWKFLENVFEGALLSSLPVCLHVNEPLGHSYSGKYDTPFSQLYNLIKIFPDLVIILSHWGGGILFYELMPEVKDVFSNVYYDTAASPYLYRDDVYKAAVNICGSGKILFGSDFPLLAAERYLKPLRFSLDNQNQVEEISGLNAMKVLKIK